jgi:AraC-like DNA-binding protein
MVMDSNVEQIFSPNFLRFPYSFLLSLGPLVYFYTQFLSKSKQRFISADFRHFIPVTIEFLFQLFLIIISIANAQQFYNTSYFLFFKIFQLIGAGISILYYLKKSISEIKSYETALTENYSNDQFITLSWMYRLIKYTRTIWVFWLLFELCFILFWHFQLHYLIVFILLYALLGIIVYSTYWIGLEGLKKGDTLSETRVFGDSLLSKQENAYQKLNEAMTDEILRKLNYVMEVEKLYLNETLTLGFLSKRLDQTPNTISYILNSVVKKSFYDYVNERRIEEVKRKINDPKYSHLKLVEVAYECGFNSKATFNRVFKKIEGHSPTDYKKMN